MPGTHRKHTPIMSGAEQGAMGVAYAAKKGEIPVSKLKGPSKEMYESMPRAELKRHLKESKGKDLPYKVTGNALRDAVMGGSSAVVRAAKARKKRRA